MAMLPGTGLATSKGCWSIVIAKELLQASKVKVTSNATLDKNLLNNDCFITNILLLQVLFNGGLEGDDGATSVCARVGTTSCNSIKKRGWWRFITTSVVITISAAANTKFIGTANQANTFNVVLRFRA